MFTLSHIHTQPSEAFQPEPLRRECERVNSNCSVVTLKFRFVFKRLLLAPKSSTFRVSFRTCNTIKIYALPISPVLDDWFDEPEYCPVRESNLIEK